MIWGLSCCAASPQMCARSGASTPRLNGASRCPYRGFGGRRSSRNRACFGLHPLKRGTRLVFRYGRTGAPFPGVPSSVDVGSSLPSVMFAAKSAPRRIRRAPRGVPRGGDSPVEIWKRISRRVAGTQSKENDRKRDWNSNNRMRYRSPTRNGSRFA